MVGANPNFLAVLVGSNTLNSCGDSYSVVKIEIHKDHDSKKKINDIAVIKVTDLIILQKLFQRCEENYSRIFPRHNVSCLEKFLVPIT